MTNEAKRNEDTVEPLVRCSIRSRQQEGSCNSCQRRDQEIVMLVELNTLTFRVCDRCAKSLRNGLDVLLRPAGKPRFVPVSDLPEWSVWDSERECDLFPTRSGNRNHACRRCDEETAKAIAGAMNAGTPNNAALRGADEGGVP